MIRQVFGEISESVYEIKVSFESLIRSLSA